MQEDFSIINLNNLQIFYYLLDTDFEYDHFKESENNQKSFEYDQSILKEYQTRKMSKLFLLLQMTLLYSGCLFFFPIGIVGFGQVFDDIEIPSKKEIKKLFLFGLLGLLYITIASCFIFKSLVLTIVVVMASFLLIFLLNLYCYLKSSSRIKGIFRINF
jgi:hypothetical protein